MATSVVGVAALAGEVPARPTIRGHIQIARIDHWFKNVFVLPGIMGCIYTIRPIRSKDLPYIDVLSESINNPLRMLAGWFIASTASVAPASLLLSYWMVGCFFMAIKRYAEYREIGDPARAAAY